VEGAAGMTQTTGAKQHTPKSQQPSRTSKFPLDKRQWFFVLLLFGLFIFLNSSMLWEWMYPIDYEHEVAEAARQFDVDPYLILAIVQNESHFDQDRTSVRGAQGLMQLMPETARWAEQQTGLDENMNSTYIDSPEKNLLLGAWYLSYLLDKYDDDYVPAIGAYNAGQGTVDRWIAEGQWDGSIEQLKQIPYGETRHYVQRVLYFYEKYQDIYADRFEWPS
jgi:soluble lytic murein transglycosylase